MPRISTTPESHPFVPTTPRFKIGDTVRVAGDRSYFTTHGVIMTIVGVVSGQVDGEGCTFYETDFPCPVHGSYNGFELERF